MGVQAAVSWQGLAWTVGIGGTDTLRGSGHQRPTGAHQVSDGRLGYSRLEAMRWVWSSWEQSAPTLLHGCTTTTSSMSACTEAHLLCLHAE